jgi:hypothetical protein
MLDPPRCRPAPRFPKARAKEHSKRGGQVEHLRQQGVSSGSGTMAAGEGDWVRRIAEAWALPSGRVGWVGGSRVGGAAVRAHARWGDQDFVTVAWRLRWRGGCVCVWVGRARWHCGDRREGVGHGMAWRSCKRGCTTTTTLLSLSLSLSLSFSARTAQHNNLSATVLDERFPTTTP